MNKDDVIKLLELTPLGFEGGYYRETYRQADDRSTAIFYMLTPETCSLMHRLRGPEIYHFYLGDPVEMLMLYEDRRASVVWIGSDLAAGQRVQHVVPGGVWQGSRLIDGGRFSLMGTTMAPGFELADFSLGDRDDLLRDHPEYHALITALTPERVKTQRLELAAANLDLLHAIPRGPEVVSAGLRAEIGDEFYAFVRGDDDPIVAPDPRYRTTWFFVHRAERRVVGAARVTGNPSTPVLTIRAAPEANTEALAGLCAHLFAHAEVQRIELISAADHPAAIEAAKAVGFRRVAGASPTPQGAIRFVLERDQAVG